MHARRESAGYDVMAFVGIERFLHHRQREEIQAALVDQGVRISTGEVSKLSHRFVSYMARLHRARAEQIRAVLEGDGGWPLHVDATGEAGRGTMLVVIAGWRQWVLGVWKIATERADLTRPCRQQTVRRFGPPCAAMRDLGKAMTTALDTLVAELKLNMPVFACHQHFLADVGKDLLDPAHAELRALRLVATVPNDETLADLEQMHEQLDKLVASLDARRPARGPAHDTRVAIDLILEHIETHGENLWGHAIRLPDSAGGGGIRLVPRTNYLSENFFGALKHDERRRSGYKNLGYVREHLPAEATLVANLLHNDYVTTVCGSLDNLPQAFAELVRQQRESRLKGESPKEQEQNLAVIRQLASASLSPTDRPIVSTREMDRRIAAAAASRAPRCHC